MALLEVGASAPSFKGLNLTGTEFVFDAVKGSKGVVLIFSPDQVNPAQTNVVKNVYEKNRAEVEFVSAIRKIPSVSMAKAFLQQLGIKFPVVYDPKEEIFRAYGVEKPVVIYAINKAGTISGALECEPKNLTAQALEEAVSLARNGGGEPKPAGA